MPRGTFTCEVCNMPKRYFWALTRTRLRRQMDRYVRVHKLLCDLDHWQRP